ncbi:MAG: FecR domain-containing protein, partial [Pseudomonadota bacterium]
MMSTDASARTHRNASVSSPRATRGVASLAALLLWALATSGPALAQTPPIGVASSVVRDVTGNAGGSQRQLSAGTGVFSDETIATGVQANSQLLFRDETTLSIGPSSAVVLDRFVYNPGGQASTFSVRAARGALRFVSGSSRPAAYNIETPVATIGVRGTIVDFFIQDSRVIVILTEGAVDVCVNGECFGLTRPGRYLVVRAGGQV